jgi:hypothetical protein
MSRGKVGKPLTLYREMSFLFWAFQIHARPLRPGELYFIFSAL